MKQKLTGLDRIFIPEIIQKAEIEGNMLEIIALKEINEKIGIRSDEFDEYGLRSNINGGVIWDPKKIIKEKEFDLTKPQVEVLKQAVENVNKKKKVKLSLIDTCLKIQKM